MAKAANPPTTPPAIAPALEPEPLDAGVGVGVDMGIHVLLAHVLQFRLDSVHNSFALQLHGGKVSGQFTQLACRLKSRLAARTALIN